jgi:uncharacterized protein
MSKLTYWDIKANENVKMLIEKANQCLEAIGYTDHGPRHVGYVSKIAGSILEQLEVDERRCELAKIAGWVHDVGNMVNRKHHGLTAGTILFPLLLDAGMDCDEVCDICAAVGNHEEETGKTVSDVSAALIIADKVDAHKARVRLKKYNPDDIHDRVNFSIKNTNMSIDKEKRVIAFDYTMDKTSSITEFLEIYLKRMRMCEEAAKFLGCTFSLSFNGVRINM